ncbi:MAG: BlaI/MecI/CopY family transcriptional regulator [Bdellovibrionales bacterium]
MPGSDSKASKEKRRTQESSMQVRFKPEEEGLEAIMGHLEAKVMEAIWTRSEASVREVWEDLGGEKKTAYTTVMTIFHRLYEKGYLARRTVGRAHRYRPHASRSEFQGNALSRILGGVLRQLRNSQPLGVVDRLSKSDRTLLKKMLDEADRTAKETGHPDTE